MPKKFTEAQLEQAFITLLQEQGVTHVLGNTLVREPDEVLIKDDLKAFLLNQYKNEHLTETEANLIIRELQLLPASDLYESNKASMPLLVFSTNRSIEMLMGNTNKGENKNAVLKVIGL